LEAAYGAAEDHLRLAHRLECEEWNARLFLGGGEAPSPTIAAAIDASATLLEMKCNACRTMRRIDLADVIWPKEPGAYPAGEIVLRTMQGRDRPQNQADFDRAVRSKSGARSYLLPEKGLRTQMTDDAIKRLFGGLNNRVGNLPSFRGEGQSGRFQGTSAARARQRRHQHPQQVVGALEAMARTG
jgi:hypothetical protein